MILLSNNKTRAFAEIKGNKQNPRLRGLVNFYEVPYGGILVEAEVFGLPAMDSVNTPSFYGFHLHENGDCSNGFSKTGSHYNPKNMEHPHHLGDLPPLVSYGGYAWMAFYSQWLKLYDVIGRSIVVHRNADDFTTQPAGNAGEKIGCGVILVEK